jgi:hypothetical protein
MIQPTRRFRSRGPSNVRWDVDVRKFFFDRKEVQRAIRRMQQDQDALRHYALYLRKVAINSIRQTRAKPGSKAWKKPSPPGKPPRSRDPQRRLKLIMAGFDPRERGMVIGPIYLKRTSSTTVPAIHEKAKRVTISKNVYPQRSRKAHSKAQAQAYVRGFEKRRRPYPKPTGQVHYVAHYPKRPFMWPAAQKTKDKFARMWTQHVSLR